MAYIFSVVTLKSSFDKKIRFLTGGGVNSPEDFENCDGFFETVCNKEADEEISIHASTYLFGKGERMLPSYDALAMLSLPSEKDDEFLSVHCQKIYDADFSYVNTNDELQIPEWR